MLYIFYKGGIFHGFFDNLTKSHLANNDLQIEKYLGRYEFESEYYLRKIANSDANDKEYSKAEIHAARYILIKKHNADIEDYIYDKVIATEKYKIERPPYVPRVQYNPIEYYYDDLDSNFYKANELWKNNKASGALLLYDKAISNATNKSYITHDDIDTVYYSVRNKANLLEALALMERPCGQENFTKMMEEYKKGIAFIEKNKGSYYKLQVLYQISGELYSKRFEDENKAIECWNSSLINIENAIESSSEINSNDYETKASMLYKLKRYKESKEMYEFTIDISSDHEINQRCTEWIEHLNTMVK